MKNIITFKKSINFVFYALLIFVFASAFVQETNAQHNVSFTATHVGNGLPVPGVEITMELNNNPVTMITDVNGVANFNNMPSGNYKVSNYKNDYQMDGIGGADISLMVNHILALNILDPHLVLAGDINKSGEGIDNKPSMSGIDIVELRKLILGIYSELPQNDSYIVYEENGIYGGWDQRPQVDQTFNLMVNADMNVNLSAVKVGDVDDSVVPRSGNKVKILSVENGNGGTRFNLDTKVTVTDLKFVVSGFFDTIGANYRIKNDTLHIIDYEMNEEGRDYFVLTDLLLQTNDLEIIVANAWDTEKTYEVVFLDTSTSDLQNKIKVYPNPADEFIKVEGIKIEGEKYSITNSIGQQVLSNTFDGNKIDLYDLFPGSYTLTVSSGSSVLRKNFIKTY